MAYVVAGDFREGTEKWWTRGGNPSLLLTESEAPPDELTSAIAAVEQRVDEATGDHFEPVSEAVDLDVSAIRGTRLYLPRRIRTVTSIETRDADGVLTAQASTLWRVRSSLNAAGTDFSDSLYDYIDLIKGKSLSTGSYWPIGSQVVRITAAWYWAAVPADIKRATALLVYDHFKPVGENMRRASEWRTIGGTVYERPEETVSGLPEVDGILAQYRRLDAPGF